MSHKNCECNDCGYWSDPKTYESPITEGFLFAPEDRPLFCCDLKKAAVEGYWMPGFPYEACNGCMNGQKINSHLSPAQKVYGTTVDVKRQHFQKFANLIFNQFNHGGDKYKLKGFEDREATDVISSVFGGETEFDWILGTCMKYLFRFKNFQREKDLLKIATYMYILWLKQGNHLIENHDEDTKK